MLSFIKRHIFIILIFIFTLSVTFLTFLTFIGKSLVLVSENNLNYLLYLNIGLLIFFFIIIIREISISIKNYINTFKVPIGYSDHTTGSLASLLAVSLGATIIEKHFTLNKKQKGADHKFSLEPKELKMLVRDIRRVEALMGNSKIKPHSKEVTQRKKYFRSILAKKDIKKNEKLTISNIALKRTSNYAASLSPKYFYQVLGKNVNKNIYVDEKILLSKLKN